MKRRLLHSFAFMSLLFLILSNFTWPHRGAPIASAAGQAASTENFPEFIRAARETARLKFLIPKETSQYQLTSTEGPAINQTLVVCWGGKIWIDLALKQVVSIASEALEIPMNFPFTSSKTHVDYELIPVGSIPYWLPVHAEFNSATGNLPDISPRMRAKEMKNVIEFSNYRKFSVEVRVKP